MADQREPTGGDEPFSPHGRYIVAPDSTPPVATTLFQNMKVEWVERSVKELNERASERNIAPTAALFDFSESERKRLVTKPGSGADALIEKFNRTNAQLGVGAQTSR